MHIFSNKIIKEGREFLIYRGDGYICAGWVEKGERQLLVKRAYGFRVKHIKK